MPLARKLCVTVMLLISSAGIARSGFRVPIAVSDVIGITHVAGTPYFAYQPKTGFASFSPDGKSFVIVLVRGNLSANTNDYSLLRFGTAEALAGSSPRTLAQISSAADHPGLFSVQWSSNSRTIYFLAAKGKHPTELYSVDCRSGKISEITHHPTSLLSYGVSSDAREIVYEAEPEPKALLTAEVLRQGLHIDHQELADLMAGLPAGGDPEIFLQQNNARVLKRLSTQGQVRPGYSLSLSPDGRYLALETDVRKVPRSWSLYQDSGIESAFRRGFAKGSPSGIMQYEILDTSTGRTERPLDSPAGYCPAPLWSPDSRSLILCSVYLPLDTSDPRELQRRRSTRFAVELDLRAGAATKIAEEALDPLRWQSTTGIVEFQVRQDYSAGPAAPKTVFYRQTRGQWKQIGAATEKGFPEVPAVFLDQDLNRPPSVVAVDPRTGRQVELLNLNPRLSRFALGKVETVTWKDGIGRPVTGALYLPVDYIPGKRYPLVIQTHGFDPHAFWLDGPYTSGFAAQVLAGRGIAVLQFNDIFPDSLVTRREGRRVMRTYENAVTYLDHKGIADPRRVGLLGFSRSCYYAEYTLTHSKLIAAAVVIDGIDAGYLQYLVASVSRPDTASEFETMNGAAPFGAGLKAWFRSSPGFRLERVHAPLLIEAFEPASLLDEWQPFAVLKRLRKPVDLLYLPEAQHVLVRPWNRLAAQSAAADWFYFWLERQQDPDPAKAEQYRRWKRFRSE